jgi:leucyl-tRNA synthetase
MIFTNEVGKLESISQAVYEKFLKILSPFAPYVTEEIWFNLGNKKSIHISSWPKWDENLVKDQEIKIAVQINGKVRAELVIQVDDNEEDVKKKALLNQTVLKFLAGVEPKRVIYVKNKVINMLI